MDRRPNSLFLGSTNAHASNIGTEAAHSAVPAPREAERPATYADRVGEWCISQKPYQYRKNSGLFLTPLLAADFMAEQIKVDGPTLRVLDPAAGAGILCCAAVEALVSRDSKPGTIELVAYEIDKDLIGPLRAVLDYLAGWCYDNHGVTVAVCIEVADFVLANADALRPLGSLHSSRSRNEEFDAVISNPPYFEIGKADPCATAASIVVHGQPNIYALFMAVGAALLRQDGDFITITPRSFASGLYFRRFRTIFFDLIRPTKVHVFNSRRAAFSRDEVLQENVILVGTRQGHGHRRGTGTPLVISSSRGIHDIGDPGRTVQMNAALDLASVDKVLRLPICNDDEDVLGRVDSWPSILRSLGLDISTGRVVPFRAKHLIRKDGTVSDNHVPLLWMIHVRAMQATWPLDRHKPEYIERSGAEGLLVPNRNYVLLRRFSAKEEARRLTAAPYIAADFAVPTVGIENHLNYIHRPGGTLSEDEAWGLAALYNSRLIDTWFRAVNGNTQVNATELRAMPLPAHRTIITLGRRVMHLVDPMKDIDELVMSLVAKADSKNDFIERRTSVRSSDK